MLLMILTLGYPKLLSAKITDTGNGVYTITSQNIREIAIIKAERDYYREIAMDKKKSPFEFEVGVSTAKGLYMGVSYGF